jgi:CRP/FNR family cyclic AMP-dependent transcriptional regulator
LKPKPRVPVWRWALWWLLLAMALVLFYVILTPFWMGLRGAAWLAEFRARSRKDGHSVAVRGLRKSDDPKLRALRSAPLFEKLSERELEELERVVDELDVPAGKALTTEGAFGYEFFIVLEGRASVTQAGQEIGILGPGDFFGEIALVEDTPRTATVTASTPLRFFVLTRQAFRSVVDHHPEVDAKVRDAIAKRP